MRRGLITALILPALIVGAEPDPYRHEDLRELMEAVTLYVSFDAGFGPDLAAGAADEPRLHGGFSGQDKRPDLTAGLLGQALVLGTGSAVYPAPGNASLNSRGAIAFWIKPESWKTDNDPNSVFVHAGRHFIVERQGPLSGKEGTRNRDASLLCIGSAAGQQRATSIQAPDLPNGVWAFIVANWSWPRIEMSINGAAPRAKATAGHPPADAFSRISLGARTGSRALMDEVLVFSRPLTPREIRALYRAFAEARSVGQANGGK